MKYSEPSACTYLHNKKVKVKMILDIAPLTEENSLHKCSGMACTVEEFHSFTCTPTRLSTNRMTIPASAFPAKAGRHLQTLEGWQAELA